MYKRLAKYFLVICLIIMAITAFSACSGNNGDNGGGTQQDTEMQLMAISANAYTLQIRDTFLLEVQPSSEEEIEWTSADNSVATVENGLVKGLKVGNVQIKATCGKQYAVCQVEVIDSGIVPTIETDADGNSLSLTCSGQWQLAPVVKYNGKSVQGISFRYSVEDQSVATVSADGLIKAVAVGNTVITISSSWEDFNEITYLLNLSVKENRAINIKNDPETIYATKEYAGQTFKNEFTLSYETLLNGEIVEPEESEISIISLDTTVARVEGDKVVGLKGGKTEIVATWTNSNGKSVSSVPLTVQVEKAYTFIDENYEHCIGVSKKLEENTEGNYATAVFDKDLIAVDKIADATYNGNRLDVKKANVEDNSIQINYTQFASDVNVFYVKIATAQTDTTVDYTNYAVTYVIADYVMSTTEEFKTYFVDKVNTENFIKGSYALLADINAKGLTVDSVQSVINGKYLCQFHYTATFNGLGHRVDGLKVKGGLFHSFVGTMKNVAFTNMVVTAGTYKDSASFPAIVARQGGGKIENCYFQATFNGDFTAMGGIFSNVPSTYINDGKVQVNNPVVISNTIVDTNISKTDNNLCGNVIWAMANNTTNPITLTNVFAVNKNETLMFGSTRIGATNTVTLKNGNDPEKTLTAADLSEANAKYKFATLTDFSNSKYGALFTGDMWDGILRFVKEETSTNKSYTGYLGISTANAEQVSGKDATVILDSDQIDVSTLNKLTYNGEELEFTIDETDNSVTFTYSSLIKGVVNSVVFTTKEETAKTIDYTNYTVSVAVADYAISTKEEFKKYFVDYANDNIFVKYTYMLLADIDATGMTMDTVKGVIGQHNKPYAQFHYTAVLDGLGHKVDGLEVKGALFHSFFGTMKNVAFTNMVVTAGTYDSSFPAIVARQGGGTIDNCYFQATFNGDDFTAIGGIFSNIPSGYVNDSGTDVDNPVVISNTVVNTNIVNAGDFGGNIAWAMGDSTRNSITMTNVFVINESNTLMFGSDRIGDSNIVTLQNGNDPKITLKTDNLSTANNYKYSTIAAFKDSEYSQFLTSKMWDKLLDR